MFEMRKVFAFISVFYAALMVSGAPVKNSDPEILKVKGAKRDYTGVFPPHVKTIAVITPASYPHPKSSRDGIALLKEAGYKVKVYPNAFTRPEGVEKDPYTAIPAALRIKDFEAAWNDKENDLIICSRGGRGTADLVAGVNWSKLSKRPELYVMGYSDVTMLLCALSAKGYGRPVAGPVASSLPGLSHAMIPQIRKMFHGEALAPIKLKALNPGDCSGKPVAGLLNRFVRSVQNKYGLETKGKIIIIECVKSKPENIRLNLDELLKAKFFDGAAGVVFGHFLKSGDPKEINAALKEFAGKVKIPVYRGLPFGHNSRHIAIDFARKAEIKKGVLYFPAVKK